MDSLVSTEWLEGELGAADLRVADATFFLPAMGRDADAEFAAGHIPGAVRFDIDIIADPASPYPHMLPDDAGFAAHMAALGIGDGDRIVVYDNSPLHSAARAWWMLRSFGAANVAILDGGMQKWMAEGRPLESGTVAPAPAVFNTRRDRDAVADKAFVASLVGAGTHDLVDARSAPRFMGEEAEPRPGLAAGHMPGALNLPQANLFNTDNSFKRGKAMRAAFADAGVDLTRPMVTTCGSGITAAILLFGAHLLGKEDVRLYDGSWSEWGADPATPKATGAA